VDPTPNAIPNQMVLKLRCDDFGGRTSNKESGHTGGLCQLSGLRQDRLLFRQGDDRRPDSPGVVCFKRYDVAPTRHRHHR
jgi:hypothetical protein